MLNLLDLKRRFVQFGLAALTIAAKPLLCLVGVEFWEQLFVLPHGHFRQTEFFGQLVRSPAHLLNHFLGECGIHEVFLSCTDHAICWVDLRVVVEAVDEVSVRFPHAFKSSLTLVQRLALILEDCRRSLVSYVGGNTCD